ncbi:MAG: branched-chain amino acid ABC transporter permease [Anaerolineales bacterium]|nr:branched-chain amino acid ABC transporter permease [Anaerolineales bacterium]
MFPNVIDIIVTGLILGGLYALVAVGLSLQYGVGRVLNVSHGQFIMVGALATWSLLTLLGISPVVTLGVITPILFAVGYALDWWLFNDLRESSINEDHFEGRSLLASFGLVFVIQNLMLLYWGGEQRGYTYLNTPVEILGERYGANRLIALGVAVGVSVLLYLLIRRTRLGKGIRAAAESPEMASALGINKRRVLALSFGLGAALAGLAGVVYSMMFLLTPGAGIELTAVAIVVVVFGGLGSITGSLVGGFILGLVTSVVNFIDPSLSLIIFYLIFMLLLLIRPSGLRGRQIHAD